VTLFKLSVEGKAIRGYSPLPSVPWAQGSHSLPADYWLGVFYHKNGIASGLYNHWSSVYNIYPLFSIYRNLLSTKLMNTFDILSPPTSSHSFHHPNTQHIFVNITPAISIVQSIPSKYLRPVIPHLRIIDKNSKDIVNVDGLVVTRVGAFEKEAGDMALLSSR